MEDKFDLEEFERLSGREFAQYCIKMKDFKIGDDFLEHFTLRKNRWDLAHLELAIWWLGKKESMPAYREVAKFMDGQSASLRFLAIGFIVEMKVEVDAQIMSRVIEALEKEPDPADKQSLKSVLVKPASREAQDLVCRYLSK